MAQYWKIDQGQLLGREEGMGVSTMNGGMVEFVSKKQGQHQKNGYDELIRGSIRVQLEVCLFRFLFSFLVSGVYM